MNKPKFYMNKLPLFPPPCGTMLSKYSRLPYEDTWVARRAVSNTDGDVLMGKAGRERAGPKVQKCSAAASLN